MFKEIATTAEYLKEGDRLHLFWAELEDGSIINGGSNILNISTNIPSPKKEWMKQEGWADDKIKDFKTKLTNNELLLVELQIDYHEPSTVVMNKNMPITIYRGIQ